MLRTIIMAALIAGGSAFSTQPCGRALLPTLAAGRSSYRATRASGTSLVRMVAAPLPKEDREDWTSVFPPPAEEGFEGNMEMRGKMERMLRAAQLKICGAIEEADGVGKFSEDIWARPGGGGGLSRVLSGGKVWEKAGCNLAVVHGEMPAAALVQANDKMQGARFVPKGDTVKFFACGLSSVMHPSNPHCPTMHFNYRYFETEGGQWWFGGGTDITPVYVDEEDMRHFHGTYKRVCDNHDTDYYPKFKKWADEYYKIQHRGETRGLGGIFFDDLNGDGSGKAAEEIFNFCEEAANAVPEAYVPIIEKHKGDAFTQEQKDWQLVRRGRYVEFNLVYDRGTIFGLKTGGRTESILMTLPKEANWLYDHSPEEGTPEADALDAFKNPREWV